jgi:GNAT superfamily N-acetyltransferase
MKRDDERHEYHLLHGQLDALDEDIARAREDLRRLSTAHYEGFFNPGAVRGGAQRFEGERVRLRDGSTCVMRPVQPADASLVREGFDHLSAVERYRRFIFDQEHLTASEATELATVDRDHVAYGAIDPTTGAGIGLARYVREPDDSSRAVTAVIVVDSWQGRGVATRLLRRLADRAREEGIEHLEAHMIVGDTSSQRMFESVGELEATRRSKGVLDVTVNLA